VVYLYRKVVEVTRENRNNGGERRWIPFKELHVYTEDSTHVFGYSLNMYESLLLVGFSGGDSVGRRDGAGAYLYSLITNSDDTVDAVRDVSLAPFAGDGQGAGLADAIYAPLYGCSVAVHDNIIVVGASLADGYTAETGAVFSYTAGIDYFPIGDNTYDFLVYFLPGAFIAIIMVSIAFVIIGNIMTNRQRQYQELHGLSKFDHQDTCTSTLDLSTTYSDTASELSMPGSSRGLIAHSATSSAR
jgi:hypothetical protein